MTSAAENAVPERIIRSDGEHGILVIGSIPGDGEPTVMVRMKATELVGCHDACAALQAALEGVVAGMADAVPRSPGGRA